MTNTLLTDSYVVYVDYNTISARIRSKRSYGRYLHLRITGFISSIVNMFYLVNHR